MIVKFEFKVTVHYDLRAKCIHLWPLKTPRFASVGVKNSMNISKTSLSKSSKHLPPVQSMVLGISIQLKQMKMYTLQFIESVFESVTDITLNELKKQ